MSTRTKIVAAVVAALMAGVLFFAGRLSSGVLDPLPGHTHRGTEVHLDCDGCGRTIRAFVVASVSSQSQHP